MKNLIMALSLFLAISVSAQTKKPVKSQVTKAVAQKSNLTPEEDGLKNINDLIKFIPLIPQTREMLQELFTTKYYMLKDAGDSAERKSIVSESITRKLQSSLDPATFEKIKSNKVLFASLVN